MVLSHRMSSCRKMAEQPKVHSSPTALLHPLATVATAQTIGGGGLTPLIQSLMSPSCKFRCPFHNSLAPAINKIHAINSDHCYPKINTFVLILSNCVPLPTRTLFDELKDVQTASASGGLITLHRSDPQTAEQEEEEDIDVLVNEETALPCAMLVCENHVNGETHLESPHPKLPCFTLAECAFVAEQDHSMYGSLLYSFVIPVIDVVMITAIRKLVMLYNTVCLLWDAV